MEQGSSNTKNLIVAGVVLVAIIIAGYLYSTRDRIDDTDLLVGIPISSEKVIDGDLLSTLRELKRLRLDEAIFSSQSFLSLTDQSRPLPAQTSGRINPFAPLESTIPTAFASSSPLR
jgi:hypothetical protein